MASEILAFDYQPRTRVVFGPGTVQRVGELARELNATRALLVTDPGIVAAGHADRVKGGLQAAGISVLVYDQVKENPTTREVDDCLAFLNGQKTDLIVGLGGGSSLDTAKGCNFLLTNGGRMQDYWGVGKAAQPMLPLIAIPTTAGTGSECQSFALIADEQTHQKMACGDPKAAARVAILDPELTVSQPRRVTACTGIDAIAHAVETAVTKRRNGLSLIYSLRAFSYAVQAFPRVLEEPKDLEARGRMQLAAALAGMAIENSMLGAAHSAANPLTAHFGIVHGQAVGIMLPIVVRFNGEDPETRAAYAELAVSAGLVRRSDPADLALSTLAGRLDYLLNVANMPRSILDAGAKRSEIARMSEEAARQWTANFNPRALAARDFERMYETACEPRGEGDKGASLSSVRTRALDAGGA
ncbi:MAG: iron-containing alcohol dehydrogenase [Planctomycetota bacterium]|nr:iron-containing alcohol dehydrogenase [Planctomycetota bacterium]